MRNLLNANFSRLFRSKAFWVCAAAMTGAALVMTLLEATETYTVHLEQAVLSSCLSIYGVVTAVFVSLFLGAEYGDGTIRNKIAVGVSRETIYLSGYVTAVVGCMLMYAAAILAAGLIGIALFDAGVSAAKILDGLGLGLLIGLSYGSMYCLVSMLCHNKALTAVCCLVLALALLFLAVFVNLRLAQPETVETLGGIKVSEEMELGTGDGNSPELKTVENPYYVSGVRRKLYTGLQRINPAGQAADITSMRYDRSGAMAACSLLLSGLCCLTGLALFRRKDIK